MHLVAATAADIENRGRAALGRTRQTSWQGKAVGPLQRTASWSAALRYMLRGSRYDTQNIHPAGALCWHTRYGPRRRGTQWLHSVRVLRTSA